MMKLLGFIMIISPVIFFLSLLEPNTDIWDSIKLIITVDLCMASIGIGAILMTNGGLLPL